MSAKSKPQILAHVFLMGFLVFGVVAEARLNSVEQLSHDCVEAEKKDWKDLSSREGHIKFLRAMKEKCGFTALGQIRFDYYYGQCKAYLLQRYKKGLVDRNKIRQHLKTCRHLAEVYQNQPEPDAKIGFDICQTQACRRIEKKTICHKEIKNNGPASVLLCRRVYSLLQCMQERTVAIDQVRWKSGSAHGIFNCSQF